MTKNLLDGLNSKAEIRRTRAVTVLDLGIAQKRIPNSRAVIKTLRSRISPTRYSHMFFREIEKTDAPRLELIHVGDFKPCLSEVGVV
jgi:hypothetical protein